MAAEIIRAQLAHHVPGRLRLRLGAGTDADDVLSRIESALATRAGYERAEYRPGTRSLVVRYNPAEVDSQRLIDSWLPVAGIEVLSTPAPERDRHAGSTVVGNRIVDAVGSVNRSIGQATRGALDLRDAFPLTLFAFGVQRVAQGNLQPVPWYNLLYYGYSTFFSLHARRTAAPPEPDAVELLRRRFARGDIGEVEFTQALAVLGTPTLPDVSSL
jgi:hypothetical protein